MLKLAVTTIVLFIVLNLACAFVSTLVPLTFGFEVILAILFNVPTFAYLAVNGFAAVKNEMK